MWFSFYTKVFHMYCHVSRRPNGNGKADEGSSPDANGCGSGQGWLKALEGTNGKKLRRHRKSWVKRSGHRRTAPNSPACLRQAKLNTCSPPSITLSIVLGQLAAGRSNETFRIIRQVGKKDIYSRRDADYTYNSRNQLVHRENLIRYEAYDYKYDEAGSLLTDSRSKYEWDARGHLTKVTFPDGFGEKYVYDMKGRRISKTQFNHQGETQQTTNYHYKGDTWVLTEEVHSGDNDGENDGESDKTYTYDANDRPLPSRSEGRHSGTSTMDMETSLRSPTKTGT